MQSNNSLSPFSDSHKDFWRGALYAVPFGIGFVCLAIFVPKYYTEIMLNLWSFGIVWLTIIELQRRLNARVRGNS